MILLLKIVKIKLAQNSLFEFGIQSMVFDEGKGRIEREDI